MNKIAIPALLVATIMVAGAFAFMPVEQASTVHASGVLTSTAFAADAVDSAAMVGVTSATGFIRVEENTSTAQVVATTAFDPVASTTAIVTCSVSGDSTAAITAGVITLTADGDGTIQSTAARAIDDAGNGLEWGASATWVSTGITTATIFTCTTTGTNNDAAVDSHDIVALYMTE